MKKLRYLSQYDSKEELTEEIGTENEVFTLLLTIKNTDF